MTLHDDILGADAAEVLLDLHGEPVAYRSSSVGRRELVAIVDRGMRREASPGAPNPGRVVPHLSVTVLTDPGHECYGGISPDEMEDDSDQDIEVASIKGGTARWRRITRASPGGQAGGMLVLEVKS